MVCDKCLEECYLIYAAQQGIAQNLEVKQHQHGLAFALTDFKLQGRTLPKLILSLRKRARKRARSGPCAPGGGP